MTRNATRDALCQAARESRAKAYPWPRAVDEIRTAAEKDYAERGQTLDGEEFAALVSYAVAEANAEPLAKLRGRVAKAAGFSSTASLRAAERALAPGGRWHPDTPRSVKFRRTERNASVFTILGPAQWAKPVKSTEFLISKVLCRDTFGVNAGPKKSLKTHDNQAIAFAVATGQNLYGDSRFPVRRGGRVLYIVGEGGEVPVRRTLHRMARAYGIDPADVARDPDFGLVTAFGAAPLDGDEFRSELRAMLDTYQPELVLIESFYNFHPRNVEAGNLFERGQIIDAYHKLVRAECTGATSLLTDHYRSTGTSKSLDLDNIAMAGQAENADSWLIRYHRAEADVAAGEFRMRAGFGSRQWGGSEWNVDWHLGEFDHESGHHVGQLSWDVCSPHEQAHARNLSDDITDRVAAAPWTLTRLDLVREIGCRNQDMRTAVRDLLDTGRIAERRSERGSSKAKVLGPPSKLIIAAQKENA